jgi:formate hydrogenlyase subunit 3/multisubunit Na+/H+ antiporter MnhD subunit
MKDMSTFYVEFNANIKNAANGLNESEKGKGWVKGNKFFASYGVRLNIIGSTTQQVIFQKLSKIFLSQVIFLLVFTLTLLNYMLDLYQEMLLFNVLGTSQSGLYMTTVSFDKLVNLNSISLNLLDVYLYPFIYVFLLITVLSIVFCLSYNKDELISFMFYCKVILLAGYFLFFTDSLIIFFFAYEMLLVPSFFILYKFAKTRRCIEAAYLMFF